MPTLLYWEYTRSTCVSNFRSIRVASKCYFMGSSEMRMYLSRFLLLSVCFKLLRQITSKIGNISEFNWITIVLVLESTADDFELYSRHVVQFPKYSRKVFSIIVFQPKKIEKPHFDYCLVVLLAWKLPQSCISNFLHEVT